MGLSQGAHSKDFQRWNRRGKRGGRCTKERKVCNTRLFCTVVVYIPPLYFLPCRKRRNSQSKAPASTKKRAGTEEERSESEEEEETPPDSSVPTASASGGTQRSVIIT